MEEFLVFNFFKWMHLENIKQRRLNINYTCINLKLQMLRSMTR